MQVISCLIREQDSISLPMSKRFYGLVGEGKSRKGMQRDDPKKRLLSVANSSLQYILLLLHQTKWNLIKEIWTGV